MVGFQHSGIETLKPPQDEFSPSILSGITPPIPMVTNFNIPFGDILLISSRDLSKIPEDTNATFYNSTSSPPTNPKVQLVKPYPTTYVKSNSNSISKTTSTLTIKLSDSNVCHQIWSSILNEKNILSTSRGMMEAKNTGARPMRTGMPPFQRRNVILC